MVQRQDDQSDGDITAMLMASTRPDAAPDKADDVWESNHAFCPPTIPQSVTNPESADSDKHPDAASTSPNEQGSKASDKQAAMHLPSTADLPHLCKPGQKVQTSAGLPESLDACLARLAALKQQGTQASALTDSLAALNARFDALKGPKPAVPDLADLHDKFHELKGCYQELPSLPELEDRFAKLQQHSSSLKAKVSEEHNAHLVPDFDADVELNDAQLKALANMDSDNADPVDASAPEIVASLAAEAASLQADLRQLLRQQRKHQQMQQQQQKLSQQQQQKLSRQQQQQQSQQHHKQSQQQQQHDTLSADQLQHSTDVKLDARQALLSLDSEDDLSEQQLHALATMGDEHDAVPAWTAAAGLAAEDLASDKDLQHARPGSRKGKLQDSRHYKRFHS